jgi:hypothetical protein
MLPSTVSTLSLSAMVCPFQIAFAISAFQSFWSDAAARLSSHVRDSKGPTPQLELRTLMFLA